MPARSSAQPLGVVAFSFGLRQPSAEPNPSNAALARWAAEAATAEPGAVVVAQWEIARGLADLGVACDHVVERSPGRYLDTATVWSEAAGHLRRAGVREVVAVAQPFLHLRMVRSMVAADGFVPVGRRRRPVPFDRSVANEQWWTRSRARLVAYAAGRQVPALQRALAPLGEWPAYG